VSAVISVKKTFSNFQPGRETPQIEMVALVRGLEMVIITVAKSPQCGIVGELFKQAWKLAARTSI
jgi:hypothetical protein